uniref:A-kinase anchoring protein 8 n=1 Tax=Myotis lucifugus TaxID=59463 RepID=G1Q525_MYOLU
MEHGYGGYGAWSAGPTNTQVPPGAGFVAAKVMENYNYYAQNTSVTTAAYSYGPASWEATKAGDGLAPGGPAIHMASYGPEPCTDNSDLIAKINQRLDMMSKEGGRGGSSTGGEGMQDRESSFRFQSFDSYDSRPCLPEHNPYRPSYSYNYDFDLGPDRNGGFGSQYSDCRPAREPRSLDGFMRGRDQGRFQDRSNAGTFMRTDPFMTSAASSQPLSAPWTEMNYVGGRGLGGPSPSRPPPSLFSQSMAPQSMAPNYGVMGMQGAGGYDNSVPYRCGQSQTRMRDRPRWRGFDRCGPDGMGRKRKQLQIYDEPDAKQARADSEGDFSENDDGAGDFRSGDEEFRGRDRHCCYGRLAAIMCLAAHVVSAVAVQVEASKHVLKTCSFTLVLGCIHVTHSFQPVVVDRCLRSALSMRTWRVNLWSFLSTPNFLQPLVNTNGWKAEKRSVSLIKKKHKNTKPKECWCDHTVYFSPCSVVMWLLTRKAHLVQRILTKRGNRDRNQMRINNNKKSSLNSSRAIINCWSRINQKEKSTSQGEDPFTNEAVDPEIEGVDNLGGDDKEETPEEVAEEVLAEVITAAVKAVEGEGVPTPKSIETLAEGESPVDTAEATSGPHPEQPLEADTHCGMASGKGNAEAEAASEEAQAGNKAAEAEGEAEAEGTVTITVPAPAATEAEVEQTDAESKDVTPTE